MTNIKEACRNCPGIERCTKTVANNINNLLLPTKKQVVRCVNFKDFESTLMERAMDDMNQALMTYQPTNIYSGTKSTTFNSDYIQAMKDIYAYHGLKKIKMKPLFYNWFRAHFIDEVIVVKDDSPIGYHDTFAEVLIEVDDEINEYYELVY